MATIDISSFIFGVAFTVPIAIICANEAYKKGQARMRKNHMMNTVGKKIEEILRAKMNEKGGESGSFVINDEGEEISLKVIKMDGGGDDGFQKVKDIFNKK